MAMDPCVKETLSRRALAWTRECCRKDANRQDPCVDSPQRYRAIRPHLELLTLPHPCTLDEPSEPLEFAYFLNAGWCHLWSPRKTESC
jgi:hypothetical protein